MKKQIRRNFAKCVTPAMSKTCVDLEVANGCNNLPKQQ